MSNIYIIYLLILGKNNDLFKCYDCYIVNSIISNYILPITKY